MQDICCSNFKKLTRYKKIILRVANFLMVGNAVDARSRLNTRSVSTGCHWLPSAAEVPPTGHTPIIDESGQHGKRYGNVAKKITTGCNLLLRCRWVAATPRLSERPYKYLGILPYFFFLLHMLRWQIRYLTYPIRPHPDNQQKWATTMKSL